MHPYYHPYYYHHPYPHPQDMHPSSQLQTSETSEHSGCKQIWSADLEQREMVIEF